MSFSPVPPPNGIQSFSPTRKRPVDVPTPPPITAKSARLSSPTSPSSSIPSTPTRSRASSARSSPSSSRSSSPSRPKTHFCDFPDCDKAYSRPSLLEQHQRSHTNCRPFKCPSCDEGFTRKDHLSRHILKHKSEEEKPLHCSICGKGVNSTQHLKRHEKTHFKSFHCHYEGCSESFYKHQSLKAHINGFHNSERLQCGECGKIFNRPGRLSEHVEKHHTEIAKLICDFPGCFKVFKVWSALQLHIKTDHPKISCQLCGKKCVGPTGLSNHMKIHDEATVVKLWKCTSCDAKFLKKDDLIRHFEELHSELELPDELKKQPQVSPKEQQQRNTEQQQDNDNDNEIDLTLISENAEGDFDEPFLEKEDGIITAKSTKAFNKALTDGLIRSPVDLITGNVDERKIECPIRSCDRKFKKDYDLRRHLEWHEKRRLEIEENLKRLREETRDSVV